MTSTTAVSPLAQGVGTAAEKPHGAMGRDDFLKLLMAQMNSQDPTAPMDAQAFVAQLATLAQVEGVQQTNSQLESLLMAQAANNQLQAASLLGDTVLYNSKSVTLPAAGGPVDVPVALSGAATNVTVVIKNAAGNVVRTLQAGAMAAGNGTVKWDGLDDKGNPMPPGDYTLQATASDAAGKSVDVTTLKRAKVDGVTYSNGYPELKVGPDTITLADVKELQP